MTDLGSILSSAQGGQLVANLSQRFGLSEEQIQSAIAALAPALSLGLEHAAEQPQVFEKTLGVMAGASRYSFFDEPDAAHSEDSVALGSDLLGNLFGSPEATGQILQAAARQSGVSADVLSQLLPILASVLLSGLTKTINDKGLGGILGQLAGAGALGPLLEQILGGGAAAPGPQPQAGRAGGGLGGLLGGILGSLLGGRRAPPNAGPSPRGPGGRLDHGDPLDVDSGMGSGSRGLPQGLDQASIQQAIEEIQRTLQVGRNGGAGGSAQGSDLEKILGQILGKR